MKIHGHPGREAWRSAFARGLSGGYEELARTVGLVPGHLCESL